MQFPLSPESQELIIRLTRHWNAQRYMFQYGLAACDAGLIATKDA